MRKTFYVASSVTNINQTRELAACLINSGYSWACGHDWTDYAERGIPLGTHQSRLIAAADISAAIAADLFVILRTDVVSHGAHAELGARIASGREAHIILQDAADHVFYYHPLVLRHATPEAFLGFIKHGPKSPPELGGDSGKPIDWK